MDISRYTKVTEVFLWLLLTGIPSLSQERDSIYHVQHQEKVYLHFDQTAYFLEETMWFNAYVLDESNRPTDISRVLYVELVSPEGGVVNTFKGKIENGTCHGQFVLDSAYLSGFFEVRAYTRYMMNFGKDNYFSRVFPIYEKVTNGDYHIRTMLKRTRPDIQNDDNITLRKKIRKVKSVKSDTIPLSVQRAINSVIRHYNLFKTENIRCDSLPCDLTPGEKVELIFRTIPNSTFSLSVCAEESHISTNYKGDIWQTLFRDTSWVARSYRALRDFNPQENIHYAVEKGITVDGDLIKEKRGRIHFVSQAFVNLTSSTDSLRIGGRTKTDKVGKWSFILDDFYGIKQAHIGAFTNDLYKNQYKLRVHKWFSPLPRPFKPDETTIPIFTAKERSPEFHENKENRILKEVRVTAQKHKNNWKEVKHSLVHYSFAEENEYLTEKSSLPCAATLIASILKRYYYPYRPYRYMIIDRYEGDHAIPKGECLDFPWKIMDNYKEIIIRTDYATCQHYDYTNIPIKKFHYDGDYKMSGGGKMMAGIMVNDEYPFYYPTGNNSKADNVTNHLCYMVCFVKYEKEELAPHNVPKSKNTFTSRNTLIRGYSHPQTFCPPDYSHSNDSIKKDFRRTLYWNPEIKSDTNGIARVLFYNNSYCRSLLISAEGIGSNKNPIIYKKE